MPRIKLVEQDRQTYELFKKAVGFNIKQRRLALKMNRRKFGFYVGISLRLVQRYEEGLKLPRLHLAYRMTIVLRCKLADIVPRTPILNERRRRRTYAYNPTQKQVRKKPTSQRSMYEARAKARGFTYPKGYPFIDPKKNAEIITARKKRRKIKTRAEVVREKSASVQKKARGVQKE